MIWISVIFIEWFWFCLHFHDYKYWKKNVSDLKYLNKFRMELIEYYLGFLKASNAKSNLKSFYVILLFRDFFLSVFLHFSKLFFCHKDWRKTRVGDCLPHLLKVNKGIPLLSVFARDYLLLSSYHCRSFLSFYAECR